MRPDSIRHPVTGAPNGVQIMAMALGGDWTLVVNNLNTSAQTVSVRLPSNGVVTSAAYRTSAGENIAAIGPPTVSTGTASLQLPAQSATTYVCHAG